jgi:predicted nucleic acid-binding protein
VILFCDTSALLKLFILEQHTEAVIAAAVAADAVAVSRLAWPEFMSALARRAREIPRDAPALAQARQEWVDRWADFVVVEVDQPLVELAGDYAEAFALRAYDSVQLAALQTLRLQSGEDVRFACFDSRLVKAAAVLGVAAV